MQFRLLRLGALIDSGKKYPRPQRPGHPGRWLLGVLRWMGAGPAAASWGRAGVGRPRRSKRLVWPGRDLTGILPRQDEGCHYPSSTVVNLKNLIFCRPCDDRECSLFPDSDACSLQGEN